MRPAGGLPSWVSPTAVLVVGLLAAVVLARAGGISGRDTAVLITTVLLGAAGVVVVVMLLRRLRPRQDLSFHAAVIALASIGATVVGVVVAARAMFISTHDLSVLGVILATATAAGLTVAWRLGDRISGDVRSLSDVSERLAAGDHPDPPHSDVTELDRLGTNLVGMAALLEQAHQRELALERSRRELVAWVSHDLRSPLAGIRAMAEAIEDGVVSDPAETRQYLRSIGEETDRLAALVDDLFELSRVSSGLVDIRPAAVGLTELLRACARGATQLAEAKSVRLRLPPQSSTDEVPDLYVSEPETVRVIRNLLDNAVRHTPAGGVVAISVSRGATTVEVSVIDECGGIPLPDLERVFDVAYRSDNARGRDGGGGLGLAVARGLAEAQQGSIAVSNHRGGCCFTVELPLADPG